jgi:hypothetical protein
MSGLAYFFKPKISANDSASSTTEKRPGRRSKSAKTSELPPVTIEKNVVEPMETNDPLPETSIIHEEQQQQQQEQQPENPPTQTPKIKLKFNLRSQSVQDTSDDRIITNITNETNDLSDDESSDNDTRLKIDDNHGNFDEQDSPLPIKHNESSSMIISPTTKQKQQQSSRKKVISHLIGTTTNTLSLDEPSPIKIPPNDSQFSEVKQTKSGRTIKYTPYFKELVQGATISPPTSPVHTPAHIKRPSSYSKKKQTPIKADLDAIKNGGLPTMMNVKGRKSTGSPKNKKQTGSPTKRGGQGRKSTTPKSVPSGKKKNLNNLYHLVYFFYLAKSKRSSNQMVMDEDVESDDENDVAQQRLSDDEEFRNYISILIIFLFNFFL